MSTPGGRDDVDVQDLGARVDALLAEHAVPGAQVGLLRDGRRTVVCRGVADLDAGTPVTSSTAFHAGSLAKSLAGLVVADAARRGELDLDVPCDQQAPGAGLWDDSPRALLAQTTGRPNLLPEPEEELEAFVSRVGALPRVHAPGRFSYCNAGWSVLDLTLRRLTGESFEAHAHAALERVLGSEASALRRPRFGEPPGAAHAHAVRPGERPVAVPDLYAEAASAAGSRWWATAEQLLAWAAVNLSPPPGEEETFGLVRAPAAPLPGGSVFDGWGHGWACWDRGEHRAFGWAGFTGGHRAYLRCFPDQGAALVVLANSAGPLVGPPGGSALFDDLLPDLLGVLGVPPLSDANAPASSPDGSAPAVTELSGSWGPLGVAPVAEEPDLLEAGLGFLGEPAPVRFRRRAGAAFVVDGEPPGSIGLTFDDDLAYLGPFALPRTG